jgi:hypothetical protein
VILTLVSEWDKCFSIIGDYMDVWCIPFSINVLRTKQSHNQVLSIRVFILFFKNPLYFESRKIRSCVFIYFNLSICISRLGELTCGYQRDEILVCCPQGGFEIPLTHHYTSTQGSLLSQKKINCGQPLFNSIKQGRSGGLGSHPGVARIGYKSKEVSCYLM